MTKPQKRHPYYSFARVFSYNAVYNFLCGGRGIGKTYGAKKQAIKDNIRRGDQFVYLRRFKSEMIAAKQTFFADIEHEFKDWDFRVQGNLAQRATVESRGTKKRAWIDMGYFVSLSTAQTQKSVAFPRVTKILFDEFIIENGANVQYLKDEVNVFNNFYNTVDRSQDKTTVYFLANAVSIMNPYFIEYEIRPDKMGEFATLKNGFILCHFPDSKLYAKSVGETRFGRFIAGTEYAKYAVDNEFADANETLLDLKPHTAVYQFTLETKRGVFSVWYDYPSGLYYILSRLPKEQLFFTLVPEKIDEGKTLVAFGDRVLSSLRTAFRHAQVMFDKPAARNAFIEVFTR